MLKTLRRFFKTPSGYDHWDAPEIWRDTPQTRYSRPKSQRRVVDHPRRYL